MKWAIVIGNRPHFIKCAPLLKILSEYTEIDIIIIHTGQHYDTRMSEAFLKDFRFPPVDVNLDVGSAPIGVQTGRILARLDPVYRKFHPDLVISMGDTNTTLAAALAAYQQHIPNAHIEAGMRERIWRPEEINKKMADHCADFLFAPIPRAVENLHREGIEKERIFLTGDITLDTFKANRLAAEERFMNLRRSGIGPEGVPVPDMYDLLTLHRAETVDHPDMFTEILSALAKWPRPVLFPVHPRTANRIASFGLETFFLKNTHIKRLPALGYLDFLAILLHAHTVATDSSGVLKEAFFAHRPCIVLDETSEYQEIFELDAAFMAGRSEQKILDTLSRSDKTTYPKIKKNPFGNGRAALKMVEILLKHPPFFQTHFQKTDT